jgi:hypothetical protein
VTRAPRSGETPPGDRRAAGLALVAALVWTAVLVLGQHEIGGRLVVVPWLALGPLAVSLAAAWGATGIAAVVSVLAVVLLSSSGGTRDLDTATGVVRVLGSASLAGFAVLSSVVRVRREARVRRVAEVAAVAQAAILHPVPARVGSAVMASRYVSATTDALVGGDLFDVVPVGRGVRIIVGDARGKGLAALHTSAAVLSAFRHDAARAELGLDDLAHRVEDAVAGGLGVEDFVTAVLCELHPDGRFDVVLCGHPRPLKLVPGRPPEEIGSHAGPPLGLGVDPRVETTQLHPGERVLLFTDGLVEARDARGRFFDLLAAAPALTGPSPAAAPGAGALDVAPERFFQRVRHHVGGTLTDDVAVLLVEPVVDPTTQPLVVSGADELR